MFPGAVQSEKNVCGEPGLALRGLGSLFVGTSVIGSEKKAQLYGVYGSVG